MPKKKFTREDIVKAAFQVTRAHGWAKCSARMIAKELGSSTMPIYTALSSMNRLQEDVLEMAQTFLVRFMTTKRTEHDFLDMGVGYVLFAQEEKNLFRFMYFRDGDDSGLPRIDYHFVLEALMPRLAGEQALTGLPMEARQEILQKMWVFSHGLAVMLHNGVIGPWTQEQMIAFLEDTGYLIITGEKIRSQTGGSS